MDEIIFRKLGQLLDLLQQVEKCMAEYYSLCASQFPENKDIWRGLQRDEEKHAVLVQKIRELVSENRDDFSLDKFNIAVLDTYVSGIRSQLLRLKNGELKEINALSIAQDYENTLVEREFFRVVKSGLPEYLKIKETIETETGKHRETLIAQIAAKAKTS